MGLTRKIRRLAYVWGWRIRYWWHDTPGGEAAHWWLFAAALLVAVIQVIRLFTTPAYGGAGPLQAVVWWVWQLIVLVVSAIISYALRPKAEKPAMAEGQGPTVQDGRAAQDCFGDVWIDEPFELAWKVVGRDKITTKGGKK